MNLWEIWRSFWSLVSKYRWMRMRSACRTYRLEWHWSKVYFKTILRSSRTSNICVFSLLASSWSQPFWSGRKNRRHGATQPADHSQTRWTGSLNNNSITNLTWIQFTVHCFVTIFYILSLWPRRRWGKAEHFGDSEASRNSRSGDWSGRSGRRGHSGGGRTADCCGQVWSLWWDFWTGHTMGGRTGGLPQRAGSPGDTIRWGKPQSLGINRVQP